MFSREQMSDEKRNNGRHCGEAARAITYVKLSDMINNIFINHDNGLHHLRQTGQLVGQTGVSLTNGSCAYCRGQGAANPQL